MGWKKGMILAMIMIVMVITAEVESTKAVKRDEEIKETSEECEHRCFRDCGGDKQTNADICYVPCLKRECSLLPPHSHPRI